MAAIIRLVHASSAEPHRAAGTALRETSMKIRSHTSVIILGLAVTTLAHAGPADGQEATPGNALNPRAHQLSRRTGP